MRVSQEGKTRDWGGWKDKRKQSELSVGCEAQPGPGTLGTAGQLRGPASQWPGHGDTVGRNCEQTLRSRTAYCIRLIGILVQ